MARFLCYVLPVLGTYALTSVYLLKNPHILHKKKCPAFYSRNIAHRGGCGERIESTMEAFTHAMEEGTDMLELDCHLTQDGHVIVSHDENLLRQTGHDITISSVNLEELPLYKETLEVLFYDGHYSTGQDRKFALLEDVFKKFPKVPISIEIMKDNYMLIKKVSALVKQHSRDNITLWVSADSDIMSKCRTENPSMPYSFSISRGAQLLLLYYTGLLPFVSIGESILQFYYIPIFNRTYIPDSALLKNSALIFIIHKITMSKGLFKHLIDRGIQVHLFVCNEERDIEGAFTLGATGVMTDYPTLLSKYLKANPPEAPPCSQ